MVLVAKIQVHASALSASLHSNTGLRAVLDEIDVISQVFRIPNFTLGSFGGQLSKSRFEKLDSNFGKVLPRNVL